MDPISNPYSPGAGSPPPELVGSDPITRDAPSAILRRIGFVRSFAPKPSQTWLVVISGLGFVFLPQGAGNEFEELGGVV